MSQDDEFAEISERRILIVEDETLVSMLLEDMLADAGAVVVGPASRVDKALAMVEDGDLAIDAAVLDVNLAGDEVFPVAEALDRRETPFVFATGYGKSGLPESWRSRPTLQKPFDMNQVVEALKGILPPR